MTNPMQVFMIIVSLLLQATLVSAETLKDPRTRDEDLSATIISASYRRLLDGMYEYIYDIESPSINKGRILSFNLDISCDDSFPSTSFTEEPDDFLKNFSLDGKHVPVQAYGVMYHTATLSIGENNNLSWAVALNPGEVARGYRVLSPVGPGKVTYELYPSMDSEGWDYLSYAEDDASVPRIDDFVVTGKIIGPACPSKNTVYSGTSHRRKESRETNELLTYAAPLRDRFHVDKNTREVEMTIHYSNKIDPKTFKAEPGYIRNLFDPVPGTSQTVMLPLKKNDKHAKKNKFKLEVQMRNDAKDEEKGTSDHVKDRAKAEHGKESMKPDYAKERAGSHRAKDTDVFEIRIDEEEREHTRERGEKGNHK